MNELNAIKTAPPRLVQVSRPSILEVDFPADSNSYNEQIATKPEITIQVEKVQPEEEKTIEQLAAEVKELQIKKQKNEEAAKLQELLVSFKKAPKPAPESLLAEKRLTETQIVQIDAIFGQRFCRIEHFSETLTKIAKNKLAEEEKLKKTIIDLKTDVQSMLKAYKPPIDKS